MYPRTANHIAGYAIGINPVLAENSCIVRVYSDSGKIHRTAYLFRVLKTYCELAWPEPKDVGV